MRHASFRTTLDIYTRAVDQQKRQASLNVAEMMLPREMKKFQYPSAPRWNEKPHTIIRQLPGIEGVILVDLIGIEPMTSSMPFGITSVESMIC
jgi:hypothetical protein